MKLYRDYTKEWHSFLVNYKIFPSNNPLRFWKELLMTFSEKIKTMDNKIEQNKAQYDLDRKTAKMSALSKKMLINKYEFLTYKVVSPGKDFLEKAATVKRFEYSPLGSELKEDTDIAKKQYQELDKAFFSSIYNKKMWMSH